MFGLPSCRCRHVLLVTFVISLVQFSIYMRYTAWLKMRLVKASVQAGLAQAVQEETPSVMLDERGESSEPGGQSDLDASNARANPSDGQSKSAGASSVASAHLFEHESSGPSVADGSNSREDHADEPETASSPGHASRRKKKSGAEKDPPAGLKALYGDSFVAQGRWQTWLLDCAGYLFPTSPCGVFVFSLHSGRRPPA